MVVFQNCVDDDIRILNFFKTKIFLFPKIFAKFPDLTIFNFSDISLISLISSFMVILNIKICIETWRLIVRLLKENAKFHMVDGGLKMIPVIIYRKVHICRVFNQRFSSDKNYLCHGTSFWIENPKYTALHYPESHHRCCTTSAHEHPRRRRSSDRACLEMVALWRDSRL